jgi:exonuclease SbcD
MKILIFNDSHDRSKNSAHRLGNMHDDMMIKLDETIELAKDCDFVIHLGDIWDSPNVTNIIIDDWLDRIEASGKTFYVLPGNHDMVGANWENSRSSALAHAFKRCKNLKELTDLDAENYYIKGYPYYYNCEKDIKEGSLKSENPKKLTIACTHSFITIKPFHPEVLHVQAKDIETDYDIVLCSHFHHEFDEVVNDTRYKNLGAWGRLSITDHKHTPKLAILDTETGEIDTITLKTAKKGKDIFDLDKVEEIKASSKNIEDFIKSLESTEFQSMNVKGMIEQLAKENNVEREVVDLILEKLNG